MTRYGRVIEVDDHGTLKVCFERHTACGKCGLCHGRTDTLVQVKGTAQAGDCIAVSMPDHQVLKSSAVAYLIPLITLLGGLGAGSLLRAGDDAAALCGALIGLIVGVAAIFVVDRALGKKSVWLPRVTGIVSEEEYMTAMAAENEEADT